MFKEHKSSQSIRKVNTIKNGTSKETYLELPSCREKVHFWQVRKRKARGMLSTPIL